MRKLLIKREKTKIQDENSRKGKIKAFNSNDGRNSLRRLMGSGTIDEEADD